jgi:predicted O-methyltransferase YrrM
MIPLRLCPPARRRPGVISVTVPSRGRPDRLTASILSLREAAKRPDLLEILVARDPDDLPTAAAAFQLKADLVWESPERYGYARSAHYWAALCERATGEWFLPTWSDDATMQTQGWDDLLRAQPPGSIAYLDGNYPGLTCFPAVHADALGAVGRLTPLPALDTWFEYAGREARVLVYPGIYVHQDRPDINGFPPDQTYVEGGGGWRASMNLNDQAFHREPYTGWRREDTMALKWHKELEAEYQARMVEWSDIVEQMPLIREAVRQYDKPVVAELGTRTGQSTSALLAGASATGGHVYSMDIGPVMVPPWWADTELWSFLPGDDMSEEAADFIPGVLDVLFIDTSHTYDHTMAELRRYAPRVKPGGTILCHDPELSKGDYVMGAPWVAQVAGGPDFPVAAALDDYCAETGLAWERQTERPAPAEGRPFYGLGTIRVPEGIRG